MTGRQDRPVSSRRRVAIGDLMLYSMAYILCRPIQHGQRVCALPSATADAEFHETIAQIGRNRPGCQAAGKRNHFVVKMD